MDSTRGSLERVWHVRRSSESRQAAVAFALLFAFRWGHTRRTSLISVRSCLHFRLVFGWPLAYTQNSPIRGDRKFARRIILTRNLRIRETATAPATCGISVEGHRIEYQIWNSLQLDRLIEWLVRRANSLARIQIQSCEFEFRDSIHYRISDRKVKKRAPAVWR